MFIEFDFLGSVVETPDAALKPKDKTKKIYYNFKKSMFSNTLKLMHFAQLLDQFNIELYLVTVLHFVILLRLN